MIINYLLWSMIVVFILLNFYLNKSKSFIFYIFFLMLMLFFLKTSYIQIFILFLCSLIFINILNNINFKLDIVILYNFLVFSVYMIIFFENLILLYLCIEIQTFCLFILISSEKTNIKSLESSLKYFILGSISSGIFLMGCVFLFKIYPLLELSLFNILFKNTKNFFLIGHTLIISSLIFKIGLFPFHYWIADIYEGSDLILIGLLSSVCKLSLFYIILKLNNFYELLFISSVLSIVIGTIAALNQTKIKRLIAYSGITNFGFILLSASLNNSLGIEITFFYLFIYILSNFFFILILIVCNNNFTFIIEFSSTYYKNKTLSTVLIIFIFSIAGVPPFLGFLNKLFLIWTLFFQNFNLTSWFCIMITIIGIGFYLRLIKIISFQSYSSYISWSNIIVPTNNFNYSNIINFSFILYFLIFYLINPMPIILIINLLINYH